LKWVEREEAELIAIGSLADTIPRGYAGIVLGTGCMFDVPIELDAAKVLALRGVLTARLAGLHPPLLADLGLLASDLAPVVDRDVPIGTVRHAGDPRPPIGLALDPLGDPEEMIADAARCQRIVSSSLHGLILADALAYTAEQKPDMMIDLATLTGAIIVALGQEYAGMFSNDDRLCERLTKAGLATGELVWRMPLAAVYDKMIDSKFADMKNTGGSRWGGAITAAQFIQRHVAEKTPWAHLDIAGTGFDSRQNDINKSWGSGWGVRLLDRLVKDYYEG
jgi:hypothetical protein